MFSSSSDDLDEIIEHLEGAKRYENYLVSLCPFHDDHRPSFFVYPDKYRCASCGANGLTSQLLPKISHVIPSPSVDNFRNPFSRWLKDWSLSETLRIAWKSPPSSYLCNRGIEYKIQKELGVGMLENWITFPIRDDNGKIVGAIARRGENNPSTSKYVIPKGQNVNLLYTPSWSKVRECKTIYVTFGILDAISLHLVGAGAFSTTCGMQMEINSLNDIRKRIVFIPDRGEEAAADNFARKLDWRGEVMQVKWVENTKDVNDLLVANRMDLLNLDKRTL